MSTEDLASSDLAEKRQKIQKECLGEAIAKDKHFLGWIGDDITLLSDRHDVEGFDPEFGRK